MTANKYKLQVPDVLPYAQKYYDSTPYGMGGCLHLLFEDLDVSDQAIHFAQEKAKEHNDTDGLNLTYLILRLSRTQRYRLAKLVRRTQ